MKIKIWGCRGSLTTPGQHTLRHGGNTTCLEIRDAQGNLIVVDAGSGVRNLGRALLQEPELTSLTFIFTHSHWDHIVGFPFFAPAYAERYRITLCGGPKSQSTLQQYLTQQMAAPYFPVDFKHLKAQFSFGCEWSQATTMGSLQVIPIVINHPNGGYGFKFVEDGKSFVFLTDNELGYSHPGGKTVEEYVKFCRGADLLLHDAQYTAEEYEQRRGWGHSCFRDTVDMAIAAQARRLVCFHHDPDRTDEDLDRQLELARRRAADAGSALRCDMAWEGMDFQL
jgi:phosphoribosyl 1,2-cyclic phosphodiesterase